MDDCLPFESMADATIRTLLAQERTRRAELEQEVRRLQAGLVRQNKRILDLERRDADRERELAAQRELVAALTEQNRLLRQQVALLRQENARLSGSSLGRAADPEPEVKPATPTRPPKVRKKRAAEHNHGRCRMAHATRWENQKPEVCPGCGEQLTGGWIIRRVQVIDLPPPPPPEVVEYRIFRRQCRRCGRQVVPPPVGLEAGRRGRCRFGPRLLAAIAVMATVERLPGRMICERLRRDYGLEISHGGIIGLLDQMAAAGRPVYEELGHAVRASPVVNADETSWRENGQHTTVWTVSTPTSVVTYHGRRTNAAIDGILGADFGGTIVSDCYAAYDHFPGPKQRCWAHLVRELQAVLREHATEPETVAWTEGILDLYEQARAARPPAEEGMTPEAARARAQRAQRYEALLLLLCPTDLDPALPHATLAKRFRSHLDEWFTFVRDPRVPPTNNAAERSLRPLVIGRKVSGGTRSPKGSQSRMILYSLCATARIQHQNPGEVCERILRLPLGAPSPLEAVGLTT